jgi:uncharacterized protein YndB with AHSA1/START domain
MESATYTYVTYINTTPEKLWNALTDPEMTRQYWFNHRNASDWQEGSTWEHQMYDDASVVHACGTVLESKPPHRLVLSWSAPGNKGVAAKTSRVTFEIEPTPESVKLSVIHAELDAEMHGMVSHGWPMVVSNLKTLLETGQVLGAMGPSACAASKG